MAAVSVDGVAYEQQKFIFHSFGAWNFWVKVGLWSGSGEYILLGADCHLTWPNGD